MMPSLRRLAAVPVLASLTIALAVATVPVAAQDTPATATPPAESAPAPMSPMVAAPAAPIEQVPLTADVVEKFVSSWPEIEKLGDELASAYGVDPSVTDPTSAFTYWAKRPEARQKIDAALTKAGFASLEEWVKIANSVVLAYGYDEAELAPERVAEIVAEIEKSEEIPAEQKPAVIAQVRQQFADAVAQKPLAGNAEVVAPFAERLGAIFGDSPVDGEQVPALEEEGAPPAADAPPADGAPAGQAAPPAQ